MKLILFIALLAWGVPMTETNTYTSIYEDQHLTFSVESEDFADDIIDMIYHEKDGIFEVNTRTSISWLEINDDAGDLIMKLPIESAELLIDTEGFQEGLYDINLLLDGQNEYQQAKLLKKQ